MERICLNCGIPLSRYNLGTICGPCQKIQAGELQAAFNSLHYTVEDMRRILGLDSQEQVRRLARDGKLPPRVPAIKRWLWLRKVVDAWIGLDHQFSPASTEEAQAILTALKLGWPIEPMTLYGHDSSYLISELKKLGYLKNDKH